MPVVLKGGCCAKAPPFFNKKASAAEAHLL
jgi:hypothetical protein